MKVTSYKTELGRDEACDIMMVRRRRILPSTKAEPVTKYRVRIK